MRELTAVRVEPIKTAGERADPEESGTVLGHAFHGVVGDRVRITHVVRKVRERFRRTVESLQSPPRPDPGYAGSGDKCRDHIVVNETGRVRR